MEMPRTSLIASVALHVVLIGFGLISLSSPRSMDVATADAISVDFVPVEENAQSVVGDEKAPLDEKPAPTPTQRPDQVADAQTIGDNSVDSKAPAVPEAKPKPVEMADAAKPQPKPTDNPKPDEVESAEEPTPVPATEVAPIPTPRQDITPDPVKTAEIRPQQKPTPEPKQDDIEKAIKEEEAKIAKEMEAAKQEAAEKASKEKAEQDAAEKAAEIAAKEAAEQKAAADAKAKAEKEAAKKLADAEQAAKEKAAAQAKAKAEKEATEQAAAEAAAAKARERKKSEKAAKEAAAKQADQGSLDDDISKLLNKEKSGGGGKRSTQKAAAGGKKTTGAKLSQNEEGALKAQMEGCWNPPAGIDSGSGLKTTLRAKVNPDKTLNGRPTIEKSSGNTTFDMSAVRALMVCDRQGLKLPTGKEDTWADLVINFDPQDMLY